MEKKKITARKISSAEEQEQALKLLMQSPSSVSDIISVPVSEQKAKTEKKNAKTQKKKAATLMVESAQEVQRITIDLPLDLYELLKREVENSGTTMKWQIMKLLRDNLK